MQKIKFYFLLILFTVIADMTVWSQLPDTLHHSNIEKSIPGASKDTIGVQPEADSILQNALKPISPIVAKDKKVHTPKGATMRSLILPGWGQAYNHEYWKVPLAAAAVGIPVYYFLTNNKEYKRAKFAYNTVFEELPISQNGKGILDPVKFSEMAPEFITLYNNIKSQPNSTVSFLTIVQNYRNTIRQYRDYSIVAILMGWGLNIADATVFGHLHGFDVGPDLSMHVSPTYLQFANTPGITFVFNLH